VLQHIPEDRNEDIVLIDPSDEDFPEGINLLQAGSESEKIILSSDLVSLFRRFSSSWGDQMTSVLGNAINAFIAIDGGGTLVELKRFLAEKKYRDGLLKQISDPNVVYYWRNEFPHLRTNSIAPILTRLDTFLRSSIIRNMMAQREGISFHRVINSRGILLVKLAQGLIGEENSYLLGSIILAKLHQAALHRQKVGEKDRSPFFLYVDEFQNFVTPSMSAILSGARKYGLGMILAHQDLEQVRSADRELLNSLLANPAIRVMFRCGEQDARTLVQGLSGFDESDLQNLDVGQAIARIERKDQDFNITTPLVRSELSSELQEERTTTLIDLSRGKYGKNKVEIEAEILDQLGNITIPEEIRPLPFAAPGKSKKQEIPEIHDPAIVEDQAKEYVQKDAERRSIREHRFLQEYIKKTGENFGYKGIIEAATPDGQGRIDIALVRDNFSIAVEVAVTNTVENEVNNIRKCLAAGYDKVVVCSNDRKHLDAIQSLFLAKEIPGDVGFFMHLPPKLTTLRRSNLTTFRRCILTTLPC